MTSDGDGLFRLPLSKPWEEGLPRFVVVKKMNGLDIEGEGRIDAARHFSPGETAVGDIRIAPAPLLASGVVVDDQGHPLSRAVVEVHRRRHADPSGEFDSWEFLDPSARFESKSDDAERSAAKKLTAPITRAPAPASPAQNPWRGLPAISTMPISALAGSAPS
jgi:hypothetical protein